MRYAIVVSEQEKIEKYTPEGMSPFSVHIVCHESGEIRWTGMFAPSDLFDTGLPQAERSLRIASFVALKVQEAANQCQDTGEDIDEAASVFLYDLESARASGCKEGLAVLRILPLGQDSHTTLPWPAQYSLQELADRAQSELTRTALQKVSQSVRTSEQAQPSVKPRI